MQNKIQKFKELLSSSCAVLIGAGSGLSTAAGFTYTGERFYKYFKDFNQLYNIQDMYSGGFYNFSSLEEYWAWWARHIYINRYQNPSNQVYQKLLELVKNKEYFVLTTNVDHCFQKCGFDKNKLFYTQGDYGLFQCSTPCHKKTYDNKEIIKKMFNLSSTKIDSSFIPLCPKCNNPMVPNLRIDSIFVEDDGFFKALKNYQNFLAQYQSKNLLLIELALEKIRQ